jgi:hypothetical protein
MKYSTTAILINEHIELVNGISATLNEVMANHSDEKTIIAIMAGVYVRVCRSNEVDPKNIKGAESLIRDELVELEIIESYGL